MVSERDLKIPLWKELTNLTTTIYPGSHWSWFSPLLSTPILRPNHFPYSTIFMVETRRSVIFCWPNITGWTRANELSLVEKRNLDGLTEFNTDVCWAAWASPVLNQRFGGDLIPESRRSPVMESFEAAVDPSPSHSERLGHGDQRKLGFYEETGVYGTSWPASNFTRKSPNCHNCPTFGLVKSLAGDRKRERERERDVVSYS